MLKKNLTQLLSLNLIDNNLNDFDKIKLLYTLSNNTEKNYKIIKIKKRRGSTRTLYAPNSNLKQVQKNILKNILEKREVSSYAKAYKKDCKSNCNSHNKR